MYTSDQGYYSGIRTWSSIPSLDIIMGLKYNSNTKRKIPQEEEVESVDGRFHDERDEKDEFRNFVKNMLKVLQDILTNIIQSVQETREFLARQLGVKDGEGSSIGSHYEERKVMGEEFFPRLGLIIGF